MPKTGPPDKSHWEEFYTEIKHQSLLHLMSCLQIASKLEDGYTVNLFVIELNGDTKYTL